MAKICSTCQAENRDEAQFCRACGTPLEAAAPFHDAIPAAGISCAECGFVNKAGVRYCAKCGVNLMGTVIVPRPKQQAPAVPPAPAYSAPAYLAPAYAPSDYPPPFDPLPVPDVPDPRLALEFEREQAGAAPPAGFGATPELQASKRTGLWAGLGVAVVVAAGVAWWFLNTAPPAPTVRAQPAATPASVASEPQPEPKAAEVVAAPAPTATMPASVPDALSPAPAPQAALPSVAPTPDAGAPKVGADNASSLGEAEAQRLAAEKKARDKAARDKVEREGKAKAAAEQREQAAARLKAEQDAARKRAEESRPRPPPNNPAATAPAIVAAPTPQSRTVKDICAGRNSISQAVCESRECGAPEHANEAICKQVRDIEERRRERLN